jgi:hypothetical protein
MTTAAPMVRPIIFGLAAENLREVCVWLMFGVSFIVYIEPAPTDVMFLLVFFCFMRAGLSLTIGTVPLVVMLLTYNIGGFASFLSVSGNSDKAFFMITSLYMAIVGILLAYYIAHNPVRRFAVIQSGITVGAFIAAVIGMIDYFFVGAFSGGLQEGRATGLFKDPNVFSTYLIMPAIMLMQTLILRTTRHPIVTSVGLMVILFAIFLSFSRGAWISTLGAAILMVALNFILASHAMMRTRILLFVVAAVILGAVAFLIMMSIPTIQDMFIQRFSLVQSYDAGETGRFGAQALSVPMLVRLPLGFGPLGFREIFGNDPHNVYLNAFASYGWLGGISYLCIFISTVFIGFKTIFTRTPWQTAAIAVFCPLLTTMLQGVQIDTEHWRHFYWMLGMIWGLYAATLQPTIVIGGWRALGLAFNADGIGRKPHP